MQWNSPDRRAYLVNCRQLLRQNSGWLYRRALAGCEWRRLLILPTRRTRLYIHIHLSAQLQQLCEKSRLHLRRVPAEVAYVSCSRYVCELNGIVLSACMVHLSTIFLLKLHHEPAPGLQFTTAAIFAYRTRNKSLTKLQIYEQHRRRNRGNGGTCPPIM